MARRLKVVQWTTGKTGTAAVRAIVRHPGLELVGCYAHSPDKVGRDVGELCGIQPIGVRATDDVEALVSLGPDCVTYFPYRPDFDHLIRILESGTNVVTTMFMLAGDGYGQEASMRIRDAIDRGGSSLYAGGIYPGHVPMVALAISAMCSRIDRLSILESVDISGYANEKMFRAQGFDLEPGDPRAAELVEASCGSFKDQVAVLGRALGAALDGIRFEVEVATADTALNAGFMVVEAGHIAGFKGVVAGVVQGRSVVECRFVWTLGDKGMTPSWPLTHGYVIEIEGDPSIGCRLEPLDDRYDAATATAMPLVNAVEAVCAAPAGVVNQMDLPFVRGVHMVQI